MVKLEDLVGGFIGLIGLYLILVFIGFLEITPQLQSTFPERQGLLIVGGFLIFLSYLASPLVKEGLDNLRER